jgi:CRISPR-associated protein Csb1
MDFERLITERRVVAIVTRQGLIPETGEAGIVFPPTYQDEGSTTPTYNINTLSDGHNICTIDSVPSQINRIELRFAEEEPYRSLVPHVIVKARVKISKLADWQEDREIDLLTAPHRMADASVRFADQLEAKALDAFKRFHGGDAEGIAQLSPMSLLFGAWDSHVTGVKIPRAFTARIEAREVESRERRNYYLTRLSANEVELNVGDDSKAKTLSNIGLDNAGSKALDGVHVKGGILREAISNLIVLRNNAGAKTPRRTELLRYLLGLQLVAQTLPGYGFLRQGCTLVPTGQTESFVRLADGSTEAFELTHAAALDYAQAQAQAFGIDPSPTVYDFSKEKAQAELKARNSKTKK